MRNNSNSGRFCAVLDLMAPTRTIVGAYIVERGVRLQTGEHFGELRRPGQFDVLEMVDAREPLPAGLASVLGQVMMGEPECG